MNSAPSKGRLLMVAFHYPPCQGGSGVHRALMFSRDLRAHGWEPVVLTAHPRAYPEHNPSQLQAIPAAVPVIRAFALDAARHLALAGHYSIATALPDRWSSWWLGAIPAALVAIRRHRPRLIWTTHPIATAHLIGLTLKRLTGLPWVADFRDPMVHGELPPDRWQRRLAGRIEAATVSRADRCVVVSEGIRSLFIDRYGSRVRSRLEVVANGYDDALFEELPPPPPRPPGAPLTLLHAGVLYPGATERNPRAFLEALAVLHRERRIRAATGAEASGGIPLRVFFRASGLDALLREWSRELGLAEIVFPEPAIPHRQVLEEMVRADALMLFQGELFRNQVPAKLYEYLRAGRPILALTDPASDVAAILGGLGMGGVAPLEERAAILGILPGFLQDLWEGRGRIPDPRQVQGLGRRARAAELAGILDEVGSGRDCGRAK
ncbi:MAG: glycosyltransferase [Magnetococcales bacterium]|nr:glycosyltransferase [Magnetococcales bacterium]